MKIDQLSPEERADVLAALATFGPHDLVNAAWDMTHGLLGDLDNRAGDTSPETMVNRAGRLREVWRLAWLVGSPESARGVTAYGRTENAK